MQWDPYTSFPHVSFSCKYYSFLLVLVNCQNKWYCIGCITCQCCFTVTVVRNFWFWPNSITRTISEQLKWKWHDVFGTYISDNFPLNPALIKYFFCLVFTFYGVLIFSIRKSLKLHSNGLNTADYFKVTEYIWNLLVGFFCDTFWVTKARLCHARSSAIPHCITGWLVPTFEGCVVVSNAIMKACCNHAYDCAR
jgi:hypothetical protein